MLSGLILAAVFVSVTFAIWGAYLLVARAPARAQGRRIGTRLEALVRVGKRDEKGSRDLFKREIVTSLPRLQRALLRLPHAAGLERALRQAGWKVSVTTFALVSAVVGAGLYLAADLLSGFTPLSLALAALGALGPYLILTYKRRKRLDAFLSQLPDAIDLVARAVRAGHAVPSGFEIVALEMEAPVAQEFKQVYDEQKFGLPLNQALLNLQERVPALDVRMMGTAISIQREVGGNLAEVLDKIAHTIRERIRIRGQVRIFTAQGKMTGAVLAALPVVLGLVLLALNRDYFEILIEHEYGIFMVGAAALLEILGWFWIRKIINVKI